MGCCQGGDFPRPLSQPLGEIPDLPSIVGVVRAIDLVADELSGLKAANAELNAEVTTALAQRDAARAEIDNLFFLLRAAEDQNARYARELEELMGAQARVDELPDELAEAENKGFDRGYAAARDEQQMACREQGTA
jgi:hypothetical protein